MSTMSVISLLSPFVAQWSRIFFFLRLTLGLASVIMNLPFSNSIRTPQVLLFDNDLWNRFFYFKKGSCFSDHTATLFSVVSSRRTSNVDRSGVRWFYVRQFHHFPTVRFPLWIRFCWWMAFHLLPVWYVISNITKCLRPNFLKLIEPWTSGLLGVIWVVLAIFLVHDSPETHPRITNDELTFLEPYCLKKQHGKKVHNACLLFYFPAS